MRELPHEEWGERNKERIKERIGTNRKQLFMPTFLNCSDCSYELFFIVFLVCLAVEVGALLALLAVFVATRRNKNS